MMTVDTKRLRELAENIIGTEFESEDFNSTLLVNHVDYNGEQHFGFEMKKSIRDFISQANPQAIIALLDRLKEAEEIVRWLADGGPCWSVHSRTMEPTFSHSEQATARAYLEKWKGK